MCDSPPSTPTTMMYWVSPKKLLDTLQYSTPAMENLNLILCFSRLFPKGRKKQSQSAKWVWLKILFKQPLESCLIARRMIDQWMFKRFSEFSSGPKVPNLEKKQGQYDPVRSNPMFHWLKRPERRWSSPHTVPSPQSPAHRCPAADVALQMFPFHQPRWIIKPSIIHGVIMKYIYIYNQLDISMKNGALPWNQRRVIMDTWVYRLSENRGSIPPEPHGSPFGSNGNKPCVKFCEGSQNIVHQKQLIYNMIIIW